MTKKELEKMTAKDTLCYLIVKLLAHAIKGFMAGLGFWLAYSLFF